MLLPLRTTPSVAEQEGQLIETEATGAPQKHHHTLNQKLAASPCLARIISLIARGPLGLHLNSGFTLDTLAFRLLEDELLIALPGEEFTVAAVSHIDLGGGSQIFRYYTSGDEFLQINTTGGEDIDDIDDIKLFVYEESYGISKESHWREAINAKVMGAMILNWQEKRWQRFFNSEEPGNIEPVYMLEKVENQNHANGGP